MTKEVSLDHVWVEFENFVAVEDANLTIAGGEFFSFLGPSGCGKTTLLRCISGFQEPTLGRIRIGNHDMKGVGPNRRPTALIFQNLALFPLRSVADNIAFPLEVRGVEKRERRRRADELLEMIALPGQGDKRIDELSGGQKQRVAIARALAVKPDILLLDEPLSALDLKLRQHMRTELRAIQKQVGLTFIYITHDQGEALTMSDRVAVMSQGKIQQVADSRTIYDRPATSFVASFVGENNAFTGTVLAKDGQGITVDAGLGAPLTAALRADSVATPGVGEPCHLFIRPEALMPVAPGSPNSFDARLVKEEFEGHMRHLLLQAGDHQLRMSLVNNGLGGSVAGADGRLTVGFIPELAVALPLGPLASA